MKKMIFTVLITIFAFSAIPAQAQFGGLNKIIKDKTKETKSDDSPANSQTQNRNEASVSEKNEKSFRNEDPNFMFIGKDDLEGKAASGLTVCAQNFNGDFPLKDKFKEWIVVNLHYAREQMYQDGKCDFMGLIVSQRQGYKYQNADSFKVLAQGGSVYRVEGDKLVLEKDFAAENYYVVVSPAVNKPGLTLKDLSIGLNPDLKESFSRKVKNTTNYHNLKQALYIFEQYKRYPSEIAASSVLFSSDDFQTLNKQGKFKGLVIYKLEGDKLSPVK